MPLLLVLVCLISRYYSLYATSICQHLSAFSYDLLLFCHACHRQLFHHHVCRYRQCVTTWSTSRVLLLIFYIFYIHLLLSLTISYFHVLLVCHRRLLYHHDVVCRYRQCITTCSTSRGHRRYHPRSPCTSYHMVQNRISWWSYCYLSTLCIAASQVTSLALVGSSLVVAVAVVVVEKVLLQIRLTLSC